MEPTLVIFLMLVVAGLVVWTFLVIRWRQGKSVLPKEPQRQVVWSGIDLLVFLLIFFVVAQSAHWFIRSVQDTKPGASSEVHANGQQKTISSEQSKKQAADKNTQSTSDHPLIVLLRQRTDWKTLFLCSLIAVVIAPLFEEFLYRLLLLGWLESLQEKLRGKRPGVVRWTRGMLPIVVTSLLFALMHSRTSSKPAAPDVLIGNLYVTAIAEIITLCLAVWFLRRWLRATWEDMGFSRAKFFSDVRLGLITYFAIAAPLYCIQATYKYFILWGSPHLEFPVFAPDPVPLFFLAAALGYLYHYTQRITAPIVVHMMLNLVSMTMAMFEEFSGS